MNKFKLNILSLIIAIIALIPMGIIYAQNSDHNVNVYLIGENDQEYSALLNNYPASLLTVSNDSIDKAYENWMYLMKDIETFAKKTNFDLNGIKIWLNVFWNKNGYIEMITYYPKPNSKNMDFGLLTKFFLNFAKNYSPRLSYKQNFNHFGSCKFPSYADIYLNAK